MKISKYLFLLLFQFSLAQSGTEKVLHFKIISDSVAVAGINVVNLVNEKSAVSNNDGSFSLLAKAEDLLVLSAVNFEYKRKIIEADDLTSDTILIKMTPKTVQLSEVVINEFAHINTRAHGIVAADQKVYTPAERKLRTAGDFKPIHLLNLLGGSLPVDPIINAITGRTANLKVEVENERKEILLGKLMQLYSSEYFINHLKIAADHVNDFQYFVIEDAQFALAIKSANKATADLLVTGLASKYNQLRSSEEK